MFVPSLLQMRAGLTSCVRTGDGPRLLYKWVLPPGKLLGLTCGGIMRKSSIPTTCSRAEQTCWSVAHTCSSMCYSWTRVCLHPSLQMLSEFVQFYLPKCVSFHVKVDVLIIDSGKVVRPTFQGRIYLPVSHPALLSSFLHCSI